MEKIKIRLVDEDRGTKMHRPPQMITYVRINVWGHAFENTNGPRHQVDVFASKGTHLHTCGFFCTVRTTRRLINFFGVGAILNKYEN